MRPLTAPSSTYMARSADGALCVCNAYNSTLPFVTVAVINTDTAVPALPEQFDLADILSEESTVPSQWDVAEIAGAITASMLAIVMIENFHLYRGWQDEEAE